MSTLEVKAIQAPTGYDLQMPAGHIVQLVSATYSTQVNNSSSSYADTGLTATITPKFSNSKIYINISHSIGADRDNDDARVALKIVRGSTDIYVADSTPRIEAGGVGATKNQGSWSHTYLDSPATTSATTYKTVFKPTATSNNGTSRAQWNSHPSTITLMEVAQ